MDNRNKALEFAKNNQAKFLAELNEFIRIPSVSTAPEHKSDILKTAEWLTRQLAGIGMRNI
ncbi:MAG: peptidase M20, partial [Bellilinea sp.]